MTRDEELLAEERALKQRLQQIQAERAAPYVRPEWYGKEVTVRYRFLDKEKEITAYYYGIYYVRNKIRLDLRAHPGRHTRGNPYLTAIHEISEVVSLELAVHNEDEFSKYPPIVAERMRQVKKMKNK